MQLEQPVQQVQLAAVLELQQLERKALLVPQKPLHHLQ
jgi:hypothetical protein